MIKSNFISKNFFVFFLKNPQSDNTDTYTLILCKRHRKNKIFTEYALNMHLKTKYFCVILPFITEYALNMHLKTKYFCFILPLITEYALNMHLKTVKLHLILTVFCT